MNAEVFRIMQTSVAADDVALRVSVGIKLGWMSGGGSFSSRRSRGGLRAETPLTRALRSAEGRLIGGLC